MKINFTSRELQCMYCCLNCIWLLLIARDNKPLTAFFCLESTKDNNYVLSWLLEILNAKKNYQCSFYPCYLRYNLYHYMRITEIHQIKIYQYNVLLPFNETRNIIINLIKKFYIFVLIN